MDLSTKKVLGYTLLFIGLIGIIFSVYSVYQVFTNITRPPEIFQMQNLTFSLSASGDAPPVEVTVPLNQDVRKVVNTFLYFLFMYFVVCAAGKISTLGTQFIKK